MGDRPLVVVSDLSPYVHHIDKSSELFEYEEKLYKQTEAERWKELCFFHESDFKIMFTDEQKKRLFILHREIDVS